MIKDIVVIPAVQHTGSRLTASMFSDYERKNPSEAVTDNGLFYAHPDKHNIEDFIALASKYPTIVPLRHPLRSAFSWQNQGKDLNGWAEEWELIIRHIEPLNPSYLRVDLIDRLDDLAAINRRFNLGLESKWLYYGDNSWPAVRDNHNTPAIPDLNTIELSDENKAIVVPYISRRLSFFGRFYNGC